MKVRLSKPGSTLSVEFDDKKAEGVFWMLAKELLAFGIRADAEKDVQKMPKEETAEPVNDMEAEEGTVEAAGPAEEEEAAEEEITPEERHSEFVYRGFMYLKCPECEKENGFHMKHESDHFHCKSCGARTVFVDPLVPLWVACECGKTFKYMTNMEAPMFEMNCLHCGAPVTVKWNERRKQYDTLRD